MKKKVKKGFPIKFLTIKVFCCIKLQIKVHEYDRKSHPHDGGIESFLKSYSVIAVLHKKVDFHSFNRANL